MHSTYIDNLKKSIFYFTFNTLGTFFRFFFFLKARKHITREYSYEFYYFRIVLFYFLTQLPVMPYSALYLHNKITNMTKLHLQIFSHSTRQTASRRDMRYDEILFLKKYLSKCYLEKKKQPKKNRTGMKHPHWSSSTPAQSSGERAQPRRPPPSKRLPVRLDAPLHRPEAANLPTGSEPRRRPGGSPAR